MAWPALLKNQTLPITKRVFGPFAANAAASKVKPAPRRTTRVTFGPSAVVKGTEEAYEWPPFPQNFVKAEAEALIVAAPMTIRFAMPRPEAAVGPSLSVTENAKHGLPLPFPSVLANPGRLGPPRFKASDRKTLGIER